MKKTDKIKNLLLENKTILLNGEINNGICFDGIVDEDSFNSTKVKLCVLLKETNGLNENNELPEKLPDWNYLDWIKNQQAEGIPEEGKNTDPFYTSTYRKLCLWITEFFDITDKSNIDIDYYFSNGSIDKEKVRMSLKKIALVNLKKSWGVSQTDSEKLKQYATNKQIKKILNKQMSLIEPDIVLCCSPAVFDIAKMVFGDNSISYSKVSSLNHHSNEFFKVGKTVYIKFYHPCWYGKKDNVLAELVKEAFEQALSIKDRI